MKQDMKKNIKVFISGIVLMGIIIGPGVYYLQETKYENKINDLNLKVSYTINGNPFLDYSNWLGKEVLYTTTDTNFLRIINKKYLEKFDKKYIGKTVLFSYTGEENYEGILTNQLFFYFKTSITKKDLIEELKKYTSKNFLILNVTNSDLNDIWLVDFNGKIEDNEFELLKNEIEGISGIYYNKIVLPEYFNEEGVRLLKKVYDKMDDVNF